ncbi:MAG: hypothetical protein IT373_19850 [Polyangiaceae bacterium]|nr:hypothetical protein [Polyangiaceae bacterium]
MAALPTRWLAACALALAGALAPAAARAEEPEPSDGDEDVWLEPAPPPPTEPASAEGGLHWILRADGGAILPPAGLGALTVGASPDPLLWFELSFGGSPWGFGTAIFLRVEPAAAQAPEVVVAPSLDVGMSSVYGPGGWYVMANLEIGLALRHASGFALLAAAGEPLALTGNAVAGLERCIPPCGASTTCVVRFPPTCGWGMPYGRLGLGYVF